ncbi:MAG: hypothetical protein ACR2K3_06770 [Nocardioides sp.]
MSPTSPARGLWLREHPFWIALALAVVVRLVVYAAFPPALVFSDGPTYLGMVDDLAPSPERPIGYGVLLWALSALTRSLVLVSLSQALLGLVAAGIAYALLRRYDVSARLATLAVVPLLFDAMQLVLEHSVLSDVLFEVLLLGAVAVLAWSPVPRLHRTVLAGVLLGTATVVRIVGEPTVLAAAVFLLLVATSWRIRAVHVVAVCVAFALPLGAYAAWYHHDRGRWALTESSGRALYMRTTSFVDCAGLSVPAYERTLCPADPLGSRQDPTYYGFHDERTLPRLHPPAGVSQDAAMRDFATRAIRAQPADYAAVAGRDLAMAFWSPLRTDHFGYDTAHKWSFEYWVDHVPSSTWEQPAYDAHGGGTQHTNQPLAYVLAGYSFVVFLPGPVLLLLVLLAVAGLVVRRDDPARTRPLIFLTLALGFGLVLVPDLTAEFVWRYQLPLIVLVPMAAALAWTRLHRQSGTTATPSTD